MLVILEVKNLSDLLVWLQSKQVGNVLTLGVAAGL
jgi:hypothetical protein